MVALKQLDDYNYPRRMTKVCYQKIMDSSAVAPAHWHTCVKVSTGDMLMFNC